MLDTSRSEGPGHSPLLTVLDSTDYVMLVPPHE